MLVLAFPEYLAQARRFAACLGSDVKQVAVHRFPDGESLVRVPPGLPEHVILLRSLDHPNDKLVELMLCAETARKLGAKRLTLIAPYLCYMRQDIENNPGEAVSQTITGRWLAELFDDVITVDPHLHRISDLHDAIPLENAVALTAANEIAKHISKNLPDAILVGPDRESEQWVTRVADAIGFDFLIASKLRHGDHDVEILVPKSNFDGKPVVLIDDIASTGRTLSNTLLHLRSAGAKQIFAVVTHPLFCGDAVSHLKNAGLNEIWSTDSIDHSTNVINLDKVLAEGIRSIL